MELSQVCKGWVNGWGATLCTVSWTCLSVMGVFIWIMGFVFIMMPSLALKGDLPASSCTPCDSESSGPPDICVASQ